MNAAPASAGLRRGVDHPAPRAALASRLAIALWIAATPAAWLAFTSAGYGVASWACYPRIEPLPAPLFDGLRGWLWLAAAVVLIVGVLAVASAWHVWQRTRDELPGNATALLEIGEGRTRFLALFGLLVSAGFLVLLAFTAASLLLAPGCLGAAA